MKQLLTGVLLLVLSFPAFAEILYFKWIGSTQRENGEPLLKSDIYQYEILGYGTNGDVLYTKFIKNAYATSTVADVPTPLLIEEFKIAVCDTDGLYSEFVSIEPKPYLIDDLIPAEVTGFRVFRR